MANHFGSFRRRATHKLPRPRDCESLEPRIVLSATAATASALVAQPLTTAMSNGDPLATAAAATSYPGGVTVTPTQVITENDTIPRLVANPTIMNLRSG